VEVCFCVNLPVLQRPFGSGLRLRASAKYISHKSFVTNVGVGHFFPGEAMTSENHGAPLTYANVGFTYRFKVEH
jgi:hypothetical protein